MYNTIGKLFVIILLIFMSLSNISYSDDFQFNYKIIETKEYEICFSPKGNCNQLIIEHINNAKKCVYIAMYSFTDKDIARALINARARNIDVRVLMYSTNNRTVYNLLLINDIDVKKYSGRGLMHNKIIIIDGKYIGTGSYNYTYSARYRNAENYIFINDPKVVNVYLKYFYYLWDK